MFSCKNYTVGYPFQQDSSAHKNELLAKKEAFFPFLYWSHKVQLYCEEGCKDLLTDSQKVNMTR